MKNYTRMYISQKKFPETMTIPPLPPSEPRVRDLRSHPGDGVRGEDGGAEGPGGDGEVPHHTNDLLQGGGEKEVGRKRGNI